jgi:hypothetical protein
MHVCSALPCLWPADATKPLACVSTPWSTVRSIKKGAGVAGNAGDTDLAWLWTCHGNDLVGLWVFVELNHLDVRASQKPSPRDAVHAVHHVPVRGQDDGDRPGPPPGCVVRGRRPPGPRPVPGPPSVRRPGGPPCPPASRCPAQRWRAARRFRWHRQGGPKPQVVPPRHAPQGIKPCGRRWDQELEHEPGTPRSWRSQTGPSAVPVAWRSKAWSPSGL